MKNKNEVGKVSAANLESSLRGELSSYPSGDPSVTKLPVDTLQGSYRGTLSAFPGE